MNKPFKNIGRVGRIVDIKRGMGRSRSIVTLERKNGEKVQTSLDYIFVIGDEEPLISLPKEVY